MKMGYFTGSFEMVPIEEQLRAIAAIGFDGVELCTWAGYPTAIDTLDEKRANRIGALARELGLAIVAIGHIPGQPTNPAAREATLAELERHIEAALHLGAPVLDFCSGGVPEGRSEEEAWRALEEMATLYAQRAEKAGVIIALEPHIANLVDTPEKTLRIVQKVGSAHFRANIDASHFAVLGLDVLAGTAMLAPFAAHTHLKDTRGRYPDHRFLIPGEGDFDTVGFCRALRDNGYDGFVTAEISVQRRRRDLWPDYDPFAAARLTYQTMERAFQAAGP